MLSLIAENFLPLAAGVTGLFMLVLAGAAVEDAIKPH